jgi:hypothetical protein
MSPNAAVQRPRNAVRSAARVHNEVTHMRRARADVSRSAATACYALAPTYTSSALGRNSRRLAIKKIRNANPSAVPKGKTIMYTTANTEDHQKNQRLR